jgi:acyl-CoA dehydrogenase
MREAINDAMDVHSGKAVIDGPSNYLQALYRAVPIGITVEGANIVTRSLIIFGQGSIRAHPHLLDEMKALNIEDPEESLTVFDKHFWKHVGHSTKTFFRALGRAWTGGIFAPAPDAGAVKRHYRQMARWSAAYALTADMAFLTMGGELKRKEMISGRMGDILSELYILSATLKRWENEGRQGADLPAVNYAAERGFARMRLALDEVLMNFPARWAAWLLRAVTLPGGGTPGPDDALTEKVSDLIYEPSATRNRIVGRMYSGCNRDGIVLLNECYGAVTDTAPLMKRLREADQTPDEGLERGTISQEDRDRIAKMEDLVHEVVAVDDFTREELAGLYPGLDAQVSQKEAAE